MFSLLSEELTFTFVFAITAAGVVPCSGPKKSPRTSFIVQIIFHVWSFEINGNILGIHYANMSVQYTAIFHGYKNDYFQIKQCYIFLIFAQNINCGYALEPPR